MISVYLRPSLGALHVPFPWPRRIAVIWAVFTWGELAGLDNLNMNAMHFGKHTISTWCVTICLSLLQMGCWTCSNRTNVGDEWSQQDVRCRGCIYINHIYLYMYTYDVEICIHMYTLYTTTCMQSSIPFHIHRVSLMEQPQISSIKHDRNIQLNVPCTE
jgi:hypothetical protein